MKGEDYIRPIGTRQNAMRAGLAFDRPAEPQQALAWLWWNAIRSCGCGKGNGHHRSNSPTVFKAVSQNALRQSLHPGDSLLIGVNCGLSQSRLAFTVADRVVSVGVSFAGDDLVLWVSRVSKRSVTPKLQSPALIQARLCTAG